VKQSPNVKELPEWKKKALKEEQDPHLRNIIINGPMGLSASWYYRHMHQKHK